MKKVTTKLKQALSILLAAAMVITMVPQNALSVSAQEEAVETVSQAEDTVLETNEETTDGTVLDGAEVSEETGDTYVTEGTDTAEIEDGDADAPDEEDADAEEDVVTSDDAGAEVYGEDYEVLNDYTVTLDTNTQVTVKAAAYNDSWTLSAIDSGKTTTSETTYTIAVYVEPGYKLTSDGVKASIGDEDGTVSLHTGNTTSSEGKYTDETDGSKVYTLYDVTTISDNITIKAKAEEITYTMSFGVKAANITGGIANVTITPKDSDADTYNGDAISTDTTSVSLGYNEDLKLKIEPQNDYTVKYVGLDAGKTDGNVVSSVAENVYTIPAASIIAKAASANADATVDVYVEVEAPKTEYKVSFQNNGVAISNANASEAKFKVYTVATGTATEVGTLEDGVTVQRANAAAGVTLYIAPSKFYKLDGVEVDGTSKSSEKVSFTLPDGEGATNNDAYVISNLTDDTVVNIKVSEDETKLNTVQFALATGSPAKSATANVLSVSTKYDKAHTFTTEGQSITIEINAAEGYTIESVKVGDATAEDAALTQDAGIVKEDSAGTKYTVTFTGLADLNGDTATPSAKRILVTTKRSDFNVTIKKASGDENVTALAVTNGNNSGVTDGGSDSYTIAGDTENVEIKATMASGYEPVVKVNTEEKAATEFYTVASSGSEYTITIPTANLKANDAIEISSQEEVITGNFTLYYDITTADVAINKGGAEYLTAEEVRAKAKFDEDYGLYKVTLDLEDGEYTIVSAAKTNCGLSSVSVYDNVKDKYTDYTGAKAASVTIKVPDITEVGVFTYGSYKSSLKAQGGAELERIAGKGKNRDSYDVDYNGTYTITAIEGVDTPVEFTHVEVTTTAKASWSGNSAYDETVKTTATIAEDKESATLTISADDAGKTLVVNLYTGESVWDESMADYVDYEWLKVDSYNIVIAPKLDQITKIGKVTLTDGAGALSQTIDSEETYAITTNSAGANLDAALTPEVVGPQETPTDEQTNAAKKLVSAVIKDGSLVITTLAEKAPESGAAAKILLKDTTADNAVKATITVTTTEPAWLKTAPTMKVTGSNTTSIDLTLGLPKNTAAPKAGSLWYKVSYKTGESNYDTTNVAYIKSNGEATQSATVTVNADATAKADYTLKAELLQAKDNTTTIDNTNEKTYVLYTGSMATKDTAAATKDPYYETKLSLKKGTTNIYTGQKNVVAATASYSKLTTYTTLASVRIKDNSTGEESEANASSATINGVTATIVGNEIKVSAAKYLFTYTAKPGKYTITVAAAADDSQNMQPATATLAITVVQGIENIELTAADRIYKANGKAASQKITTTLNWGGKSSAPKTKKVTYSLVGAGSSEDNDQAVPASISSYVKVNPSNGTITVDKNFVASKVEANNQFMVKATAADYTGSDVTGYSGTITISTTALTLGGVYIVEEDEENNSNYKVVAAGGDTVTPAQIDHAKVIVLTSGTLAKGDTIAQDAENILTDTGSLTYTSSNKLLTIKENGVISLSDYKTAKNIKITVAVNDGSGVKAILDKLTIDYADTATTAYGLKVTNYYTDAEYSDASDYSKDVPYTATNTTALALQVMVKDTADQEPQWTETWNDAYNVKLSASNAKVLSKDETEGYYVILPSKKDVTVKLTYKNLTTNKNESKEFTLTNNGFIDAKTNKAPKLTADRSLLSNYTAESQTITYTIADTYDYTAGDKVARIELDGASVTGTNAKTRAQYRSLIEALGFGEDSSEYLDVSVSRTGRFYLNFNGESEQSLRTAITKGSYKLSVTLGKFDEDGSFVPDTASQTVTLKAADPAKVSYKAVSSVKMSLGDKASVVLTGSGKNWTKETYTALHDANNAGKSNGFTKYFTLNDTTNTLSLTEQAKTDIATLSGKDGKAICNGYVDYEYEGVDGKTYTGTGKITVTVSAADKTVNTYKASAVTILPQTEEALKTANVTVTAGKNTVNLGAAVVTTDDSGATFSVASVDGAAVTLKYTGTVTEKAKYNLTLKILPKDSYYYDAWTKTENGQQDDYVKNNGIEVAVKITVGEAAKQTGKISVAKAALNQTFLNDQYDPATGNYYIDVPYTVLIPCAIATTGEGVEKRCDITSDNELVSFGANTEEQYITIALNKAAFEAAAKDTTKKKIDYEKSINVKATVKFKDSKEETLSFKLTLPKKPGVDSSTTYAELLAAIQEAKDTIGSSVEVSYDSEWEDLDQYGAPNTAELTASFTDEKWDEHPFNASVNEAIGALDKEIRDNYAPVDTGVVIEYPQVSWHGNTVTFNLQSQDFTAPTSTTAGSLKVQAKISDGTATTKEETTVEFTLTVPKTGEQPSDVQTALDDFVGVDTGKNYTKYLTISNYTTADDVADAARVAVLGKGTADAGKYSTLRLVVEAYELSPASDDGTGTITGTIKVYGTRYGGDEASASIDWTLAKLQTLAEAADAIYAKSGEEPATGALVNTEKFTPTNSTTAQDILDAIEDSGVVTNPDITVAFKDDASDNGTDGKAFKLTPATRGSEAGNKGSIKGTLLLTNENATGDTSKKLEFTLEIAALTPTTAVEQAVKDAIGYDNSSNTGLIAFTKADGATPDSVKTAILKAANDAVNKDDYTVAYAKKAAPNETEDVFTCVLPTYKSDGEISFTLKVTDEQQTDADTKANGVATIEVSKIKLTDRPDQTLAQAKADAETALTKEAITAAVATKVESDPSVAPTATQIQEAVEGLLTSEVIVNGSITKTVTASSITEPTLTAKGSANISVQLTLAGNSETISLTAVPLNELTQTTTTQAAAAVTKWGTANAATTVTNADKDNESARQEAIMTDLAGVVDTSVFTLSVKTELTITEATETTAGSAAMTVTIHKTADQSKTDDDKDVTLNFTIAKIDQTFAMAKAAVKEAVEAVEGIDNDSAESSKLASTNEALLNAASGALDSAKWQAALSTDVENHKTFQVNKATVNAAGSATVTVVITSAGGVENDDYDENDNEVVCTFTIAALDQKLSDATTAVTNALAAAYASEVAVAPTKSDVEAVIDSAIKQSLFSFEWTEEFSNSSTENTITGTIKISYKNPNEKPDGHSGEKNEDTLEISQAYTVADTE